MFDPTGKGAQALVVTHAHQRSHSRRHRVGRGRQCQPVAIGTFIDVARHRVRQLGAHSGLLGTVGLWRCDLISRQDLYPWMAALYVAPEARGQGLAGRLQQHVIEYARAQGYGELFLYSACRDFYERFGWQYIGEGLDYPASAVSLYRYDLSLSRGAITE